MISAALEIFGTAGYAATSADVVCKAAKVSTKHFYLLLLRTAVVGGKLDTRMSLASAPTYCR